MYRAWLAIVSALLVACATLPAAAQYPLRTVKLIVPQTPGGATDVFARKIGQLLSEKWGQPVVIENRAGAGGVVGTDAVAKSAAGRLHAARHLRGLAGDQPGALSEDPVRQREGFHVDRNARVDAVHPDRQSEPAGEESCRIRRARARQAGCADLCVVRQRLGQSSARRDGEERSRHQDAARALSRRRAGDHRRDRRAGRTRRSPACRRCCR